MNSFEVKPIPGFETVIYQKRGDVAWVTLNRPQVLNVYNLKMRDELWQVLYAIKEDDEVKVVIFHGAGDRAFCAGADLSEFLTAPSPIIARQARWGRDLWGLFLSLPQPLIAAVHGYVLGSGIEMALCCDLRIAAEDAQFGLPETSLGIIPAAGATQTLPRLIGRAKALEMLLAGIWLNAQEAYRLGLINSIVPRQQLLSDAEKIATKIASYNQPVVRWAKQAICRGFDLPLHQGLELEKKLATLVLAHIVPELSHRNSRTGLSNQQNCRAYS